MTSSRIPNFRHYLTPERPGKSMRLRPQVARGYLPVLRAARCNQLELRLAYRESVSDRLLRELARHNGSVWMSAPPSLGDVLRARRACQATRSRLSIEYKGIICEVLGRHLFPTRHHFERINLDRCAGGNTGFALWDRPSCDESHEQSGDTYSEQSLAHLKSPRWVSGPDGPAG